MMVFNKMNTPYIQWYITCVPKKGKHFHTKYGIPLGPGEELFLHFLSTKLNYLNKVISRSKHFCGREGKSRSSV